MKKAMQTLEKTQSAHTGPIFEISGLTKDYKVGEVTVNALEDATFAINEGELVVVLGPSGSGKSTLLNIIGGMDVPTSGNVVVNGEDISKYTKAQLTLFRRQTIGFVFQFYNLMPNLTAKENIELSSELYKDSMDIDEVLKLVGLDQRSGHFPSQLSGGEQQRIAIARAVIKRPAILLCDEPTGALDYTTGIKVLELLADINRKYGTTVVIITHNQPISMIADKIIRMRSGRIVEIHDNPDPTPPSLIEW